MVLEGLLAPQECDELRRRMGEIVEEMDVPEHCRTVFSTYHDEQTKTQVNGAAGGTSSLHAAAAWWRGFTHSFFFCLSLSRAFLFCRAPRCR